MAQGQVDRPVVDETGIGESVDYALEWMPEREGNATGDSGPGFLDALREQLGLKLEAVKAPLRVLVIDKVERPTEN